MKNTAIEREPPTEERVQEQDLRGNLERNLARVEEQIYAACLAAGRRREEVALVAVSKMHPVTAILAAQELGVGRFGENRVQEFQEKRVQLGEANPGEFHLIGRLQSNKAARAAGLFSSIDTLDSVSLAERLNQAALGLGRRLPVLLEIKLSHEEAKTGLGPESAELASLLERLPDLAGLDARGLMTVPPYLEDAEAVRPYFAQLRRLRDRLAAGHPRLSWSELSMGMSHDFPVAIEEGATQVRIGTALFGARNYAK